MLLGRKLGVEINGKEPISGRSINGRCNGNNGWAGRDGWTAPTAYSVYSRQTNPSTARHRRYIAVIQGSAPPQSPLQPTKKHPRPYEAVTVRQYAPSSLDPPPLHLPHPIFSIHSPCSLRPFSFLHLHLQLLFQVRFPFNPAFSFWSRPLVSSALHCIHIHTRLQSSSSYPAQAPLLLLLLHQAICRC